MLNPISWSSYWSALVLIVVLYYLIVLLLLYRQPLLRRFGAGAPPSSMRRAVPIESMQDEVRAYLEQAGHAGAVQAEILYGLQKILQHYAPVETVAERKLITDLIQSDCKTYCGIYFNDAELVQVWLR